MAKMTQTQIFTELSTSRPPVRNAERLKAQSSRDLSLQKQFALAGERKLKLDFQALNLTNRINTLRVQSSFTAAGVPTQVDFNRRLQLGAGITS